MISSDAWKEWIVEKFENIILGFLSSGLWPLSFPKMKDRWQLYHNGGIQYDNVIIEPWSTCKETMQTEILTLLSEVDGKRKRRKTLDVNNHLLTRDQLNRYDN